jgi:hypothetical protein
MNFGEVALRGDGITGMQLSGIDALADGGLNSLVGGQAGADLGWHFLARMGSGLLRGRLAGRRMHNKNDIPF